MKEEAVRDIRSDGAREQHWFLRHDGHDAMEIPRVEITDVDAIDGYTAALHVVKSFQQTQHR